MSGTLRVHLLQAEGTAWDGEVDRLRALLGAPGNATLFPPHFLKRSFLLLGGQIARCDLDGETAAVGFLFPRPPGGSMGEPTQSYTLRLHRTAAGDMHGLEGDAVAEALQPLLPRALIVVYDAAATHSYLPSHRSIQGLDYGRPSADEAAQVRRLQQEIWGSESDLLYPSDLHSQEFQPGTSLVARDGQEVVGFLFGFYKQGGTPLPGPWQTRWPGELRLESQLLGVLPAYRARGIALHLKAVQAAAACAAGISFVHWVTDPLLYANARLNFGRLGAVAWEFYPDFLPFRNDLNRVTPSRIRLTLLVESPPVQQALAAVEAPSVLELGRTGDMQRVNQGPEAPVFGADASCIALEIPLDWAALQANDGALARAWRQTTDELLAHYLGVEPGRYMICSVGEEGSRRFLIAQRVTDALLHRYG